MNCSAKTIVPRWGMIIMVAVGLLSNAGCSRESESLAEPQTISQPNTDCGNTVSEYQACSAPAGDEQNTEQYVHEQIRAGRPVLAHDKVLRGCFIRDLLTTKIGVPQSGIVIEGAIVRGPIDLRNLEIPFHVELINCTFEDDVNMKRSHFTKGLSLQGSSFGSAPNGPGRLDAEDATVDFDFILDGCTFKNCLTFLKSMRIGVDLSLTGAKFLGQADFTGTSIGGSFFAGDPQTDPRTEFQKVDFDVKVGMDANLSNVTFNGPAHFGSSEFKSLDIENASFNGDVNFKRTKMGDFYLGKNPAERLKGKSLMIEDMTFQYMSPEDWKELREFAERSNTGATEAIQTKGDRSNSAQFYASLEELFRKHGHSDDADQIYIAWKLREREDLHGIYKAWSNMQYWLVGYGREKEWLLLWCLPFVLFGLIAFQRRFMENTNPDDIERYKNRYCLFLYTLDLFIPIVSLGYKDTWTPSALGSRVYKPFHIIVGNLLVPIGLAAWAGIIK